MDQKDLKKITLHIPNSLQCLDNDIDELLTAIDESLIRYIKRKVYTNTIPDHIQKKLLEIFKKSRHNIITQYNVTTETKDLD
jgi:hypothetical protein